MDFSAILSNNPYIGKYNSSGQQKTDIFHIVSLYQQIFFQGSSHPLEVA